MEPREAYNTAAYGAGLSISIHLCINCAIVLWLHERALSRFGD
jgi:hypothetical protein